MVLTSTENSIESPKDHKKKEAVGNKQVSKAFSQQSLGKDQKAPTTQSNAYGDTGQKV